jgi:hypothetical protein
VPAKNRINLVVSDRTRDQLSELQNRLDSSSLTDTIKRSIELMDFISQSTLKGEDIFLRGPNGDETKLQVLY